MTGPPPLDWGSGHYERTAAQLAPVAQVVVDRASPQPAEHVLDVGCGTGNAALAAAARGAAVTGVDPAPRLLEVARSRAARDGLDVTFAPGEAAALPVEDGSVDVLLSVFGVVFAADPVAAAAEMARVTAPHGRIVLSAWLGDGAVSEVVQMARDMVRAALDAPPMPSPFAWHDRDALWGLLRPHGFAVEVDRHLHVFTAASIDDYLREEIVDHPLFVASRRMLEARGKGHVEAEMLDRAREILAERNEDPERLAVTGGYVVATAHRSRRP